MSVASKEEYSRERPSGRSFQFESFNDMSVITLAGSYKLKSEPEKQCGGDIYRSLAPKADPKDIERENRSLKRYTHKLNPRRIVVWEETSEKFLLEFYPLMSKSRLAARLNEEFPQGNGVLFTTSAISGKYFRLNQKRTKGKFTNLCRQSTK